MTPNPPVPKPKLTASTKARDNFLASLEDQAVFKEYHNHDSASSDMANPRNWRTAKKRLLFTALISSSLLADGAMTWGATLIVTQALEWDISINHSSTSMNYGILLQGFGGIFAVPLIEAYGRLPIWFWSQVITMFMVLGATLSTSYPVFTTFRSLQGLFGTVPQVVGLSIIHDMYDPKDWPRMINIWATTFLVGPFLGPAIAGYILVASQNRWIVSFGILTALYGLSTLLIMLFGYETYYDNHHNSHDNNKSPMLTRIYSFIGLNNNTSHLVKRSTLLSESSTLLKLIFKLPLLLLGISVMINFCWPIGITTTIDTFLHAPPYMFDDIQSSSMRFAGIIGGTSGYIFGHFFNEWIYKHYQSKHNQTNTIKKNRHNDELGRIASENSSVQIADALVSFSSATSDQHHYPTTSTSGWKPEYRLHGVWFPIASLVCGLITYGLTLHFQKSWLGLAFGWIMVNLGMVGSMVAMTAYALEKYPTHSTTVSAIINMWRTCGGFSVGYFQASWIARNGVGVVFGIQAAVVVAGTVVTIVPVFVLARHKAWV
ncbi:MFS transporter, putative [Talaromyces stipitatus ATCC 10500]|uniref:MFS transporter, putative n=1 Tax=Talaromyces stipitatus (strain ATCC 10500 / CBS 375.48 / QM 6759 / NRRL 1006) TaxID=441959 RepID=B8MG65_TALSN|nr:MFS transporter, putative [Talaromyces stipitatus ATCC 10500]EED15932.1 MFS transporter, putative [Talaromyces stipitatus ATCC 10500]